MLTNYYAVTHPSQPNYVASAGGDYFGMNNDNLNKIPANISSVADLLEAGGVSWGEYQERMPFTGFQGFQFLNPDGANDYVRKHKWVTRVVQQSPFFGLISPSLASPLIIYDSVADSTTRSANIKNFTLFEEDLANNALPQWMFITPNMSRFSRVIFEIIVIIILSFFTHNSFYNIANDGHDTNVTFAGTFINSFLPPLLKNPNFNTEKTLVLLSRFF